MRTQVYKVLLPFTIVGALLFSSTPALAYTVEKGDTLGEIAKENDISLHKLSKLNPQIKDIDLILVGEEVKTEGKVKKVQKEKAVSSIANSETELLAKLVEAEAKDESYKGKVAVAEVVLNRVESNQFPNSIQGVIYQKGQFSPVSNGSINGKASKDSKDAVQEALSGSNIVGKALYFWNPAIAPSRWLETKETVTIIGGHEFKK